MKQKIRNGGNGPNRLVRRLAAEKKKGVMALCLIGVMAFMWVRVLSKKTPQSAGAAMMTQEAMSEQSNSETKISFIELPNVKGRNDVLTRDFFAVDDWQRFLRDREGESLGDSAEVSVVSGDGSEEIAIRIAERIRLEAIVLGENPQTFINDKLLAVGDKLLVKDGADTYECEVVRIEEKMVFIRCGEVEITLKLAEVIEVAD